MKRTISLSLIVLSLTVAMFSIADSVAQSVNNAAIEALQATTPSTMDEFMENGLLYCKFWRNDLAQKSFEKVLGFNPKEGDWLRLHDLAFRVMPNYLDELSDSPDLQPAGGQIAEAIRAAQDNRYRSEESIRKNIADYLAAPLGSDQSKQAFEVFSRSSSASAAELLAELYKADKSEDHRKKIGAALIALDGAACMPLVAALDSDNPTFVKWCISILANRTDSDAIPYLYGYTSKQCDAGVRQAAITALKKRYEPEYSENAAAMLLMKSVQSALDQKYFPKNEDEGMAEIWTWDNKQKKPIRSLQPLRIVQLVHAIRLARGANTIFPKNDIIQKLYWTAEAEFLATNPALLEQTFVSVTLNELNFNSVENIVKLNDLLRFTLKYNYAAAAQTVCQILGELKSMSALTVPGNEFSPLVVALNSKFPTVRWSACEAIMKINPQAEYPGASELPKTLAWFMLGEGQKKVLIVAPKSADALTVGGFLPDGFEPIVATNGKEALGILQYEPEIFAVFYSIDLYSVPAAIFLEKMRNIPVAAELPVAVMAGSLRFEEAKKIVSERPSCVWVPTPTSVQDMDRAMKMLNDLRPYPMPSEELVVSFAEKAAKYGADLAYQCYGDEVKPITESPFKEEKKTDADKADADKADKKDEAKDTDKVTEEKADVKEEEKAPEAKPQSNLPGPIRYDSARIAQKEVFRKMYDLKSLADAAQYQLAQNLTVDDSLRLLQNIPTLDAQTQIIAYASNSIFLIESREKAVKAFEYSVSQFGLLLTTPQLTRQYELLESEQNEKSKAVLNSLLDIIEAPWNRENEARKKTIEKSVDSDYGPQTDFEAF